MSLGEGSKNICYADNIVRRTTKRQSLISVIVTVFVVFIEVINEIFLWSYISYLDELFAVFAIFGIALKFNKVKGDKVYSKVFLTTIVCFAVVFIVGIASNLYSGVINRAFPILIDAFSLLKMPAIFIFVFCIMTPQDKQAVIKNLSVIFSLITVVAFFFGLLNWAVDIGMSYEVRYGLRSFKFYFSNPGGLTILMLCTYGLMSRKTDAFGKTVRVMSLCVAVMTLRAAAIASVFAVLALKIMVAKNNSKVSVLRYVAFILAAVIAVILLWGQIKLYLFSESVRRSFIDGSIYVFKKYFPFGSGFATFGSDQAFKNYSQLYYELGFHNDLALSPISPYMNDNFYPMLLAQFGIVGFVAYIIIIFLQLWTINMAFKRTGSSRCAKIGCIAIFCCTFITSIGAAIYTSAFGVVMAVCIAILLPNLKDTLERNSIKNDNPNK